MFGHSGRIFSIAATAFVCMCIIAASICSVLPAQAASDLPLAAGSPLTGITFDDRPMILPPQSNFQTAMSKASGELGRSCGQMESYGWQLLPTEQQRVNVIFTNTIGRLRAQGFTVTAQTHIPSIVSRDVTVFTADKSDRSFMFLWSAGDVGLIAVLCETSLLTTPNAYAAAPLYSSHYDQQPIHLNQQTSPESFSPVGLWKGLYTCQQGTTGATLTLNQLRNGRFKGTFNFYPTDKSPTVPKGSYSVYGQYDADSQQILINPDKWLRRPKGYYNTIIIGSFDPINDTLRAYFQGIAGCTSFEATRSYRVSIESIGADDISPPKKKVIKKKKTPPKATVTPKAETTTPAVAPVAAAPTVITPVTSKPLNPTPMSIDLSAVK